MRLTRVFLTVLGLIALRADAQQPPIIEVLAASWWPSHREDTTDINAVWIPVPNQKGAAIFEMGLNGQQPKSGVYAAGAGGLQEIALSGELSPEDSRLKFANRWFNNGYPHSLAFNDSGQSLFVFFLQPVSSQTNVDGVPYGESIWYGGGGTIKRLLSQFNDPPPGLPETVPGPVNDVKLSFERFHSTSISNSGVYAFVAEVSNYGGALYWGLGGSVHLTTHAGDPNLPKFRGYQMARDVGIGYYTADSPGPGSRQMDSVYRFLGSNSELVLGPDSVLPGLPYGPQNYSLLDVDESGVALVLAYGAPPTYANALYLVSFLGPKLLVPYNTEITTPEGAVKLSLPSVFAGDEVIRGGTAYFRANYQGFGRSGAGRFKADLTHGLQLLYTIGDFLPGTNISITETEYYFSANPYGANVSSVKLQGPGIGDGQFPVSSVIYQDLTGQFHVLLWRGQALQLDGQEKTLASVLYYPEGLTDGGELVCLMQFFDGSSAICRVLPPDAERIEGSLSGVVRSAAPTLTDREHAVHRAVITIYSQPSGWIRSQKPGELAIDYHKYVRSQLGAQVQRIVMTETDAGQFSTQLLQAVKLQNTGVLRHAYYTIEVSAAETDEWVMDDEHNVDTSRTQPLNFLTLIQPNVRVPTADLVLNLQPADEPAIKRNLAENLSGKGPNYWAPIETQVINHLDNLELSPVTREALRRAILSERSVLMGAEFADIFIKEMLTSIGNLLAEIYGEIAKKESDALREAKKRVTLSRESPDFGVLQPGEVLIEAASQADWALVRNAERMSGASTILKSVKPYLEAGLVKAGMKPELAASFTYYFVLAGRSIANGLKDAEASRARRGVHATSLGIQEIIKGITKQFHPVFYDGAPFSFTAVTADVLQDSLDTMKGWNTYDDPQFLRDRADFNQFYLSFLVSMERYSTAVLIGQTTAEASSIAESYFSLLGVGLKQAKAAEAASKILKFAAHVEAIVASASAIYVGIPMDLERLNRAAFGFPTDTTALQSPGSALPARAEASTKGSVPIRAASLSASPPSAATVLAALQSIEQGLSANNIGTVLNASVHPTESGSLVNAHAAWRNAGRRFEAAAGAASYTNPDLASLLDWLRTARIEQMATAITLGEELGALFEGVLGGVFESPTSAAYITRRASVLRALKEFRTAVTKTSSAIDAFSTQAATASETPGQAIVLEPGAVTSTSTGSAVISAAGESFTLQVTAFNAGGNSLPVLPVRVSVIPEGAVTISEPVKNLPTLAPGAEASLQWSFTVGDITQWDALFITAEIDENATAPAGMIEMQADWILAVDPSLYDVDQDGMPDSFEIAHGLNPSIDDAHADLDGDQLTNLEEFELGTRPDLADTDGDGIPDGLEITGSATVPQSDPRLADTDGDGVNDADDGAPLNPDSTEAEPFVPPSAVYPLKRRVYLHPDSPTASVPLAGSVDSPPFIQAVSNAPGLFNVTPATPTRAQGGGILMKALQPFPVTSPHTFIESSATIYNLSAPLSSPQEIQVIITRQLPQGLLEELDVGGGWSYSAWYGYYYSGTKPWIWSPAHGWQYLPEGGDSPFIWDGQLEAWIYTNGDTYNWLYCFGSTSLPEGWYYFAYTPGYRGFWSPDAGWFVIPQ